jgi:hypothetical protein
MKKSIYLAFAAMALLGSTTLTGCQADMDAPDNVEPVATLDRNISIADLKSLYADKTEIVDTMPNGDHYIIKGRVISSDASGNIYKSLVIQDETAALAFSVNQSNLSVMYPLGQEIVVDMTGLYMGYYHELQQCGWLSDPYNGEAQLGFMALDYFKNHAQLTGYPNTSYSTINYGDTRPSDKMYVTVADFSTLPSSGEDLRGMQSQLVEFRNVHFKGAGTQTFAAYQETVNDTLVNAQGATLIARTSGYSNFYNNKLPEGTGSVRGILSYYGGSWQLLFRDTNDINITTLGQSAETPFGVADVLSGSYEGLSGWTKGYIVGSVKAGVDAVQSDSDIIFGPNAELDNNLVIAASADETKWENCVYVSLPQNTAFRAFANLLDNPDVYKKELTVKGDLGYALGLSAVLNNVGTWDAFSIPGVEDVSAVVPDAKGDGTKDNPYNLGALLKAETALTDVWVEGYVVGYVSGSNFSSTAVFSAIGDDSSNYKNNANIILSEQPAGLASVVNSAPVQVANTLKDTLGLKNNPDVFGKKVKIRGNIDLDWLGSHSLRKITEVVIE